LKLLAKDLILDNSNKFIEFIYKDASNVYEIKRNDDDVPIYADNATADADSSLLSNFKYKLTGDRTIYQKP
jgi:hypothetical protein